MAERLKGKIAIVTGAARGIGAVTAEFFIREGAAVALWDIKHERGQELCAKITSQGGKALFSHCDVTNKRDIHQAVERVVSVFGNPNVLLNNAATVVVGSVEER